MTLAEGVVPPGGPLIGSHRSGLTSGADFRKESCVRSAAGVRVGYEPDVKTRLAGYN